MSERRYRTTCCNDLAGEAEALGGRFTGLRFRLEDGIGEFKTGRPLPSGQKYCFISLILFVLGMYAKPSQEILHSLTWILLLLSSPLFHPQFDPLLHFGYHGSVCIPCTSLDLCATGVWFRHFRICPLSAAHYCFSLGVCTDDRPTVLNSLLESLRISAPVITLSLLSRAAFGPRCPYHGNSFAALASRTLWTLVK